MSLNRAQLGNKRKSNGQNKYKQGSYIIQNPDKYMGGYPILYRSSWEYAFCKFCDLNDKIVKWSTEGLYVPYQIVNNGNIENHRYIPDFYVEMMSPDDPEKYDRLLIEIKPKSETQMPESPKRMTPKVMENYQYSLNTFKQNLHKWAYAKKWCEKRNLKFIIITEDDLKKKGLI